MRGYKMSRTGAIGDSRGVLHLLFDRKKCDDNDDILVLEIKKIA